MLNAFSYEAVSNAGSGTTDLVRLTGIDLFTNVGGLSVADSLNLTAAKGSSNCIATNGSVNVETGYLSV